MSTIANVRRATIDAGAAALERHISTGGAASGELDRWAKEQLTRKGRAWLYDNLPASGARRDVLVSRIASALGM